MSFTCPLVQVWRQLISCNSFYKEISLSTLGVFNTLYTLIMNGGIHRNGSYMCNHMQLLSHIYKRDVSHSSYYTSSHHFDAIVMSYFLYFSLFSICFSLIHNIIEGVFLCFSPFKILVSSCWFFGDCSLEFSYSIISSRKVLW